MKVTPLRVILGLNLLVIAAIYIWPTSGMYGYAIIYWAFATVMQVSANLVLAAITGAIRALSRDKAAMPGVPQAFLISSGLALMISFPLCFAMLAVRH